jgi:hypothetical protein
MSTDTITAPPRTLLKLDLGCGANKRAGFLGVDNLDFEGVDFKVDLTGPWPWEDSIVEEAHCSHCLEHFTGLERVHVLNELWRVLIPGGRCQVIVPHFASCRAYGDFTHKWPPVGEFFFYYLSREWRLGNPAKGVGPNAPHNDIMHNLNGYKCDFEATWGYSMHPTLTVKNAEFQQFAFQFYKESVQDIIATLTARK